MDLPNEYRTDLEATQVAASIYFTLTIFAA